MVSTPRREGYAFIGPVPGASSTVGLVHLTLDVKVILTPPCIFCIENCNEIYRVVLE